MKRLFSRYSPFLWLALAAFLLAMVLVPYYLDGYFILGGEGNNFLDFPVYLTNFRDTWQNIGTGFFAVSLNKTFSNIFSLVLLQKLISNIRIINFLVIFLIYYLPFLAMFILGRQLKLSPFLSFLVALFYLINPFTIYLLTSLNQWNLASLFIIPAFFWLILRYYQNNLKLFFYFGLLSLIFAFANTNPPLMAISQISILISVIVASFYLEKKLRFKKIMKKYLLVVLSFFFFNFWWILNWFYVMVEAQKMYTSGTALAWLFGEQGSAILHKIFLLKWLIPPKPDFNFLAFFYNLGIIQSLLIIPVLVIIFFFLKQGNKRKYFLVTFLFLMVTAFLMKGTRPPLGEIYVFLIKYLPFFSIFKTSAEKWGVLFIFLFSLLLIFSFKGLRKSWYTSLIRGSFILYLLLCSFPFITSNFIPDYKIENLGWGSRRYKEKAEYRWVREHLNNDREEHRVLSLPGSFNYQVALHMYADKYYTGLDPLISNINKPFITAYGNNILVNFDVLFNNISFSKYKKLLSLFNVRKILLNKNMYPWFGFKQGETIGELEERLDRDFTSEKRGSLVLYNSDQFLPRFYIPDYQIYALSGKIDNLIEVIGMEDRQMRLAVFFREEVESDLMNRANEILIFAKTDKITGEELSRSTTDIGAVFFPYTRWSSDSLFYSLVLKKEQWGEWRVKGDSKALFEKKLFYAAKRISEIEKFFSDYDEEKLARQMEAYRRKIEEAIEIASEQGKRESLLEMRSHLKAHKNKIESFGFSLQPRVEIEKVFIGLEERLDQLGAQREFNRLVYNFTVPVEGEYEILTKIDSDLIELMKLGEERIESQPPEEDDWVSFGKHSFSPGVHSLVLSLAEPPNLIETEEWQRLRGAESGEEELSFSVQNLFPAELFEKDCQDECTFYPNKESFAFFQKIKNYQPNTIFRIEFDYLSYDAILGYAIIQDSDRDEKTGKVNPILQRILPPTGDKMKHADFLFKSGHNASSAKLYFFSRAMDRGVGEAEVKNIKIQRVYKPTVLLKKINSQSLSKQSQSPTIVFSKVNSAKYKVRVKGAKEPYTLVFGESYHRGWQAYIKETTNLDEKIVASYFEGEIEQAETKDAFLDRSTFETWGKKPIPKEKHHLVNGYANSWHITPEDIGTEDYEIIIEFWPQKLFYLGIGISLVALLGCVSFLGFSLAKSKVSR